jgi:hypothetical protein
MTYAAPTMTKSLIISNAFPNHVHHTKRKKQDDFAPKTPSIRKSRVYSRENLNDGVAESSSLPDVPVCLLHAWLQLHFIGAAPSICAATV